MVVVSLFCQYVITIALFHLTRNYYFETEKNAAENLKFFVNICQSMTLNENFYKNFKALFKSISLYFPHTSSHFIEETNFLTSKSLIFLLNCQPAFFISYNFNQQGKKIYKYLHNKYKQFWELQYTGITLFFNPKKKFIQHKL